MKKLLTFTILLCSAFFAFSQGNNLSLEGGMVNVRLFPDSEEYKNVEGSPYYEKEFIEATINGFEKEYAVRYNAYTDKLEVKAKNDNYFILDDKDKAIEVTLVNSGTLIERIKIDEDNSKYMFLVWNNNGASLYKSYSVGFIPEKEATGYKPASKAKFTKVREKLYLVEEDSEFPTEISSRANKIFRTIFTNDIKDYAKEKDLDPTVQEDLILLLEHFYKTQ